MSLISAIRLNRKLRASELIVLPGFGHSVFEETPEESNRIMLEWLVRQSLSASRLREKAQAPSASPRATGTARRHRLSPGT
jgi:hypothetical protein